jgi:hypothetical protein
MDPTTQSIFTTMYLGDCYEIRLHGCTIAGITKYVNGSSFRQELEYGELPVEIQDKILDRVHKILLENN